MARYYLSLSNQSRFQLALIHRRVVDDVHPCTPYVGSAGARIRRLVRKASSSARGVISDKLHHVCCSPELRLDDGPERQRIDTEILDNWALVISDCYAVRDKLPWANVRIAKTRADKLPSVPGHRHGFQI